MTENLVKFNSENFSRVYVQQYVYAKEFLEQRRWKSNKKSIFHVPSDQLQKFKNSIFLE